MLISIHQLFFIILYLSIDISSINQHIIVTLLSRSPVTIYSLY